MRTPSGRVFLHFPEGRWEVILEILMGPSDTAFFFDLGILLFSPSGGGALLPWACLYFAHPEGLSPHRNIWSFHSV